MVRVRHPAWLSLVLAVDHDAESGAGHVHAQLYFYIPALTPYWQAHGLSLSQISSLQALLAGSGLLLDVPTGVLADCIGRRWSYTLALGCQVLAESTFLLARDYWVFALAQVWAGAGGALLADLRLTHITIAIELTILCMSLAFAGSFFIPETGRALGTQRPRLRTLLRDGLGVLRHNRRLQRIVLVYLLTDAFPVYLLVLYQPYLLRAGVSGAWLGAALGLGSLLALLGQRYAYRLEGWLGVGCAVLAATALPALLYLLMAMVAQPVPAVLLFCLQWGVIPIKEPLFSAYVNAQLPSGQRATVLSLVNTLHSPM